MDRADHGRPQHLPLAHHEVFQEEDCHVVVGRQEDPHVTGEEIVYLPLAPILGGELLGRDLGVVTASTRGL